VITRARQLHPVIILDVSLIIIGRIWPYVSLNKSFQDKNLPRYCNCFFKMTRDGAKIINAEFHLAPVVQKMENTIHQINRKPADEFQQNKPCYPLDSDLSGE